MFTLRGDTKCWLQPSVSEGIGTIGGPKQHAKNFDLTFRLRTSCFCHVASASVMTDTPEYPAPSRRRGTSTPFAPSDWPISRAPDSDLRRTNLPRTRRGCVRRHFLTATAPLEFHQRVSVRVGWLGLDWPRVYLQLPCVNYLQIMVLALKELLPMCNTTSEEFRPCACAWGSSLFSRNPRRRQAERASADVAMRAPAAPSPSIPREGVSFGVTGCLRRYLLCTPFAHARNVRWTTRNKRMASARRH